MCLSLFPKNPNPESSVSCDRASECVLTEPCIASLDQVYICQSFSTGVPQDKLRRKWLMEAISRLQAWMMKVMGAARRISSARGSSTQQPHQPKCHSRGGVMNSLVYHHQSLPSGLYCCVNWHADEIISRTEHLAAVVCAFLDVCFSLYVVPHPCMLCPIRY